jgi:hypothetical protein
MGLRPRKYSSRAPGFEMGSNVGRGVGDEPVDPLAHHEARLAADLDPLHGSLRQLRLDVAGEGIDGLVVVVVAVEEREVHLAHESSSAQAQHSQGIVS